MTNKEFPEAVDKQLLEGGERRPEAQRVEPSRVVLVRDEEPTTGGYAICPLCDEVVGGKDAYDDETANYAEEHPTFGVCWADCLEDYHGYYQARVRESMYRLAREAKDAGAKALVLRLAQEEEVEMGMRGEQYQLEDAQPSIAGNADRLLLLKTGGDDDLLFGVSLFDDVAARSDERWYRDPDEAIEVFLVPV